MAELKKLTEDKRQAVHPRLSQCQLGRDGECVRKNRLTGWKQGHTPERRFGAPAFGGGFFLPRVIHRPCAPNYRFEPQNASQALLLVLQAIKNPL